jgi:hypothetical protein
MKKLIWTALAATVSTAAAAFAVKGLAFAWHRLVGEPPPFAPRWARLLVAAPLGKGVVHRVGPATV